MEQMDKEYSYFEHNTTLFDWDDGQEHAATVDSMYLMIVGPRNYVYHYRHKFAKLQDLEQIPEHKRREMYIVDLNVPIPEPGQKVAVEVRARRLNRFLSDTHLDVQSSQPERLTSNEWMNRIDNYIQDMNTVKQDSDQVRNVEVDMSVRRINNFIKTDSKKETPLDLQSPPAWLATSMLMNRFNHYTRENWGLTNK